MRAYSFCQEVMGSYTFCCRSRLCRWCQDNLSASAGVQRSTSLAGSCQATQQSLSCRVCCAAHSRLEEGSLTWDRCSWPALMSGAPVPITGCTEVPSGELSHT